MCVVAPRFKKCVVAPRSVWVRRVSLILASESACAGCLACESTPSPSACMSLTERLHVSQLPHRVLVCESTPSPSACAGCLALWPQLALCLASGPPRHGNKLQ